MSGEAQEVQAQGGGQGRRKGEDVTRLQDASGEPLDLRESLAHARVLGGSPTAHHRAWKCLPPLPPPHMAPTGDPIPQLLNRA